MAGDWIKMRADLFTHPKVVRISSALKADTLRTVGGLMSVWCLFDAHSIDGELDGYTQQTLDDHLRWSGFSAAMIAVKWLQESPESLVLPEFDTHNGQSAKRRAQDADRKKEVRKASAPEADKKRTREEKRRGNTEAKASVPRASKKCPADFALTPELTEWAAINAPAVDTAAELEKLKDYTFKTARVDWAGTLRNWLRKAQEDVGQGGARPKAGTGRHAAAANTIFGQGRQRETIDA